MLFLQTGPDIFREYNRTKKVPAYNPVGTESAYTVQSKEETSSPPITEPNPHLCLMLPIPDTRVYSGGVSPAMAALTKQWTGLGVARCWLKSYNIVKEQSESQATTLQDFIPL